MLNLGVNVDHVATVREARKITYPSPLEAALLCEKAGAWGITAHLREDRRHMNDQDMIELKANVQRLNMEMALTDEMVRISGQMGVPVILVDSEIVVGFDKERLDSLLSK